MLPLWFAYPEFRLMLVKYLPTNLADTEFEPTSHEERMAINGRDRYRARQEQLAKRGTAAERDDYASLIRQSLLDVADRVTAAIDKDQSRKKGGPRAQSRLLLKLKSIDVEDDDRRGVTISYIILSTIFNSLHSTNDKKKIATKIGRSLEQEYHFHHIATTQPELWSRLVRFSKDRGSQRHKAEYVLNTARKDDVDKVTGEITRKGVALDEWSQDGSDQALLGEWLLKLVEDAGLIVINSTNRHNHTTTEIALAEHVLAWLEEFRKKADAGSLPMVTPVLSPLTEPPVDWTKDFGGGYRSLKYRLTKSGSLANYQAADMSKVYGAVNLMQRTAWHINPVMLALVEYLWAEGEEVGKLPLGLQQDVPPRLDPDVWAHYTRTEQKGLLLQLRDIHEHNRQAASDLVSITMVLAQAQELQAETAIYMPYQLDFRGRAYCAPLLNPQGADYIRSLFEFSNGKPVGERGGMWIAIQAATLWDGEFHGKRLSKSSFQSRYEWVEENEEMLRSVVADPLSNRQWANADKPFQFLRTVMDWVGYLDYGDMFVSSLPIALDGSCSGIQHYAAILRDPEAGSRVNLTPTEVPADVYGDVSDMVVPWVTADADSDVPITREDVFHLTEGDASAFWLDYGVTRKIVKKPTMTFGYSSRIPGFTSWYEKEYVRPTLKKQGRASTPSDPIARYLAKKTLTAVEILLPAVAKGMDWLMDCAARLAHEGKGVSWTAPSGFPVVQCCTNTPAIRVETYLGGEKLRVSIPGAAKTISKEKQKSAISPNHTHSLDAAHLILTVLKADEYGVSDFAVVHDSFGTLAADTDNMFAAVRDAFVEMYEENDPFQHFYEQAYEALSEEGRSKLLLPPSRGDLDLSLVRQSLYAFA